MRKLTRRSLIAGGICGGVAIAAAGGLWWTRSRKPPLGMGIPEDFRRRGAALLARGMSEGDAAKVLGGNFLRLFDDVTAARIA